MKQEQTTPNTEECCCAKRSPFFHKHGKSTFVIGHRGAKSLAKVENTQEAFQIAMDMQLQMIEFDVRRTLDAQLIVFHNNHFNKRKLNTFTYAELCECTHKEGYIPPLLSDVLKECQGNILLDIELKEAGYEADVIALVMLYFTPEQFVITSFHDRVIKTIKEIDPQIRTGLLLGFDHAGLRQRISEFFPMRRLKASCADFVVPHFNLVTPMLVKSCKHHNYDVVVWTVNSDKVFRKLQKKQVTAIITDYPQRYAYL